MNCPEFMVLNYPRREKMTVTFIQRIQTEQSPFGCILVISELNKAGRGS